MKKISIISFIFFAICLQTIGQSNIWYFGDYSGLKFNGSGSPTALTNSAMWTGEGSAVITDANGELLFYTDGVSVWNSKHNKDFTGMKGHSSSTQTALIIPVPETNCKRYFIFTVGGVEDFSLGANVTLVEMSGDSKSGTTIKKIEGPTRMYSGPVTEKLNGIKDGSGGYWIVNHEWQSNNFHSFHVTKNTTDITKLLATNVVTSIGLSQTGTLTNGQGQLKFNRTGSKMAIAVAEDKYVEIYDFSLSTGKPSNVQLLQNNDPNFPSNKTIFSGSANLYGLEFSNNGNFLYIAEFFTGSSASVFQFDLSSGNLGTIRNSKVTLGTNSHSSRYPYGALLMGPDGKIYIARTDRTFLGVIRKPDQSGTSCDFVENGITLSKQCYNGLPTTIVVDFCCSINKPFLGKDTSICKGQQLVLKDTVKNVESYLWSDSSTKSTLTVSKSGTYWVEIGNGDCKKRDTITITVKNIPKVILGKDTLLCNQVQHILGSKLGGPNYLWSTTETTKTIMTSSSGNYWVVVDSNGCKASDTIKVTFNNLAKPTLGKDTNACEGKTISLLGVSANAKSYSWNNGIKIPQNDVTTSGTFILTVTDNICTLSDTIRVTFIPYPTVNLGRDTGFCGNFSLTLDAKNPGLSKIWSTTETTQTINITNLHGSYWVDVSNQGCIKRGTIKINKLSGPTVNLGKDSIYCKPISITLNAQNPGMNYFWSDGSSQPQLLVNSEGKYWLRVTDANGCIHSDTIILRDSSFSYNLGNDTSICYGQKVILKGLQKPFIHTWNTGDTANTIIADSNFTYKILISNGACKLSDSLKIIIFPKINFDLGKDTSICDDLQESILLNGPSGFVSYSWLPNGETKQSISINKIGVYSLNVMDNNQCKASDDIEITKFCPLYYWIPTAFNPSSGGSNGKFGISYIGPPVNNFEMLIFNRWGELLYKSNDINGSWDGTFMGEPCQLGMYMCLIQFNSKFGSENKRSMYKGMFLLLR